MTATLPHRAPALGPPDSMALARRIENMAHRGCGTTQAVACYIDLVLAYHDARARIDPTSRGEGCSEKDAQGSFLRASIDAYTAAASLSVQSDEGSIERQAWEAIANDHYARANECARDISLGSESTLQSPEYLISLQGN